MLQDSKPNYSILNLYAARFCFACKLHNYARWLYFICRSFRCWKIYVSKQFLNEKILSEDFISLEKHNDCYLAYPTTPFIKISSNIISKFGLNNSEKIPLDDDFRERNLLKIHNFERKLKKVLYCFFLKWGEDFSMESMSSSEKVSRLIESTYNAFPLVRAQSNNNIFKNISEFIRSVEISRYLKKDLDFRSNQNIIDYVSCKKKMKIKYQTSALLSNLMTNQ